MSIMLAHNDAGYLAVVRGPGAHAVAWPSGVTVEEFADEAALQERLQQIRALQPPETESADDLTTLAEAVEYLLSTRTAAEAQTLRQRVAEIIERRRR